MLLNLFEFMLDLDQEMISSKEFDKRLGHYLCRRISRDMAMKLYQELKLFKEGKSILPECIYDIDQTKLDKAEEYLWLRLLPRSGRGVFGPAL